MSTRLIISIEEIEKLLEPRGRHLRKKGIDTRGLLEYSFIKIQKQDYQDLNMHISKDVLEVYPQLVEDHAHYRQVVHNCLDYVIEAAQHLIPTLQRVTGQTYPQVEFDRFVGPAAVVRFEHDM